jgi:hypothetical protein
MSPERCRVLTALHAESPLTMRRLCYIADVHKATIKKMVADGQLEVVDREPPTFWTRVGHPIVGVKK